MQHPALTSYKKYLRDFLFRGLIFESEAIGFQKAGIQIGADLSAEDEKLLAEQIAPFSISRCNNSIEMARLYALLHCFESEVIFLIRSTPEENEGIDWRERLPQKVKGHAKSRQETAFKDSWPEGEKEDLLGFVDFGMLAAIIIEKWAFFEDIIPSQHWRKQ